MEHSRLAGTRKSALLPFSESPPPSARRPASTPPGAGGRDPAGKISPRTDTALFYAVVFTLTAVTVWPLWSTRFLPMQDYPQHLFLAHLSATWSDPAYNWKDFYCLDLQFRPYMLWYLAMNLLTGVFEVETAGRMLFSLYIVLITLLVLSARRLTDRSHPPWGMLLIYPFAFNQMYYLGFPNYLLSLPLLFLALLDLDSLVVRISAGSILRHGLYLVLLLLNHPYTALVYIVLGAISALYLRKNRRQCLTMLVPLTGMALCFALWYLLGHGPSSAPTGAPWQVSWWNLPGTAAYYLLPFTGMRWTNGPDWIILGLWGLGAALFVGCSQPPGRTSGLRVRRTTAWYLASLFGFLVLPFWMGYYSYFNLRLAPVSYFALALTLGTLRMTARSGALLAFTVLMLLTGSIRTQKTVSQETATLLPVLSKARANALILPLVFDGASGAVDPVFFYQLHGHETDYYHVLVGGGANPALFPNAMMPVQYRPGVRLPRPDQAKGFSWTRQGAYYDYLLVRKAPPGLYGYLALTCRLLASSGPWDLFQNKSDRRPLQPALRRLP